MSFKSLFWALDFCSAVIVCVLLARILPHWIRTEFAKDIYGVAIGVLAIIFSVFFAALTIIMASSDDEFVRFLEQTSDYTGLIATVRFTLIALFCALAVGLVLYTYSSFRLSDRVEHQHSWWLIGFAFMFVYSLVSSLTATLDAIKYSIFRSKYLQSLKTK